MTTLADRINARLAALPEKNQADLARAAGVKGSSVAGWKSGKTKDILAKNVWGAAEYLECDPYWLATGELKQYNTERQPAGLTAAEQQATYMKSTWPFHSISETEWNALPERDKGRVEHIIAQEIAAAIERKKNAA